MTAQNVRLKVTSPALKLKAAIRLDATVKGTGFITVTQSGATFTIAPDIAQLLAQIPAGIPGGSDTQLQYNNAGAFAGITGATTNGTALTLVAPVLGTPASGTLTNCIGLPMSTGISGFGSGVATVLAINIGLAGSPVLLSGALGTPSSGTATNLTGTASGLTAGHVTTNANLTGDITSVGNATTLAAGSAGNLNSGTLLAARMPALTGDITTSAGAVATTLATVNSNVGAFGSATSWAALTVNAKGLLTACTVFSAREKLAADRTYYGSPTGNIANTGLTVGSPWPLQAGLDKIFDTIDAAGFTVTFDIWSAGGSTAPVAYTSGIATNKGLIGGNGAGSLQILGQPKSTATVTITIASPGVISGISLFAGQPFYLTTTGSLPTNATKTTKFYSLGASGQFSLTAGGAAVNTTGTQSGTHTLTTTPACSITTTSGDAINIGTQLAGNTQCTFGGILLSTVTSGNCISVTGGGAYIAHGMSGYPMDYGPCANSHIVGSHLCNMFSGTFNIVSGSCGVGTGVGIHGASQSVAVVAFHNTGEIFLGAPNSLSFPSGYWNCEDAGSNLYIDNMDSTNVNTAAVNTAFAWGLVSGGARIKNYPTNTTPFANGAVAVIGVGSSYATTGLEKAGLNQGGTAADLSATGGTSQVVKQTSVGGAFTVAQIALSDLTTFNSAALRTALTDETGTGLAYFQGGDIGTPSAGVATNLTGTASGLTAGNVTTNANLTGAVTSVGNAASLGSFSSATLATALTDEVAAAGVSGKAIFGTAGNLPATATNDSANAGNVGEYIESVIASGSAVALTTATPKTVTSVSLTAGDWDVEFVPEFTGGGTTTVTYLVASISQTTNVLDQTNGRFIAQPFSASAVFNNVPSGLFGFPGITVRFSLSATTSIFAVAQAAFATSTCSGYGLLRARRAR